jgi:hypothetical protein
MFGSTLVVKIKKTQESTPRFLKRITEISLLPVDWGLSPDLATSCVDAATKIGAIDL